MVKIRKLLEKYSEFYTMIERCLEGSYELILDSGSSGGMRIFSFNEMPLTKRRAEFKKANLKEVSGSRRPAITSSYRLKPNLVSSDESFLVA